VSRTFDSVQGVTYRMPRTADPATQQAMWRGAGDAWTWVSELLTATAVWGAIGFGLDRWLGTWPILFAIGAVMGHGAGIYMLFRRSSVMSARARTARAERAASMRNQLSR